MAGWNSQWWATLPKWIVAAVILWGIYSLGTRVIAIKPIKIMPLGDSITQGMANDNPQMQGTDSYRRHLYLKLSQAGYDVDFIGSLRHAYQCGAPVHDDFDVDHEGHWGWRVDDVIRGKESGCFGSGKLADWLQDAVPDVVLLHLGTNDAYQERPIAVVLDELGQIIDILRDANPGVAVFVAKLIPTNRPSQPELGERVAALNAQMHLVAERHDMPSSRVIMVDQYSHFEPQADTLDGIHPNHSGDEKMAERWFQALQAYLPPAQQ